MGPDEFRARFPGLATMTHLASCSQGALSDAVAGALGEFQDALVEYGNPWHVWMERVEQARRRFAAFIGAHDDEVAIVPCASDGAFQVVSGLSGPTVVSCELEFPSVAQVWHAQRDASVRMAPLDDRGFATAEGFASVIDDRTRLVSVPLVSYRHGQRLPVADIVATARAHGAQVFVDAYQATGVVPVDVRELDCDYLVSGALKYLLGVAGIAFLYVRRGTARDLDPQLTGWFGRVDPFSFDPTRVDFPAAARRYETGTPSVPAAYAAAAGIDLLASLDRDAVHRHVVEITGRLHAQLADAGERLGSPAGDDERGPMVALLDDNPEKFAAHMAEHPLVTSPRGSFLRLSVHYYTDDADVDAVVRAVAAYR
ncbi:aminotransferase class V-fold PLP-dependent enzyme [Virgisporangium ochraceum]